MNMVQPGPEQKYRIHYVRITNHLSVPFTDRHDGVPVTIEPGQSENLPLDMAAHFFGYYDGVKREEMYRHVCKRQGWNSSEHIKKNPETGKSLAETYFDGLEIKAVIYKMVEEVVDDREPIPADRVTDEDPPVTKAVKGAGRAQAGAA